MSGTGAESITVLHVDDDPAFLDLAAEFIEREGEDIEVVTAPGAADGLDRLDEGGVDCVVSDYDMPGTDGIEFLAAVRETHPELPFVLFTGKGSEEVASEAVSAGVTDYLRKSGGTEQYEILANRIENAVAKRHAEVSYREIFEKATDGIMLHDPETGAIRDVNRRFCEMLGYDRETLLQMDVSDFSAGEPPYTQAEAERRIRAAAEGGPEVFEWRNVTRDGERLPVEVHLTSTTINGEQQVLAMVRDVSERRTTERKLRAIVENTSQAIYIKDREGRYELINDPGAEMLGRDREEVVGKRDEDLFEAADAEAIRERDEEIMAECEPTTYERRAAIDGDERVFHNDKFPYVSDDGEVLGVIGISEDVTRRRERERQLRESERRFEAVFDDPDALIGLLDPDGTLLRANQTALGLIDADADDVEGQPLPETPWWDHDPALQADLREWIDRAADGEYVRFETVHRTPAGQEIPVAGNIRPVRADGEVVSLIAEGRDVTERKERERQLERQNERLEEFARVVSHDLRNPLGVAQGRLKLLAESTDDEHVAALDRALSRIEAIVDDVLTLARQGRTVNDPEPVDGGRVVAEAWDTVATEGATLENDLDGTLVADESRVRQLLENLFANAVEHGSTSNRTASGDAPEQPEVSVRVGPVLGGFYVEDDGPGIPPEDREQVFESGYSTAEDGTGLGLSIANGIAEAHGWTVRATEGTDGGARFEVTGVTFGDD